MLNLQHAQSRRAFLQAGTLGALGWSLADWQRLRDAQGASAPPRYQPQPLGGQGSADAVILVWLWGGPSHLDTFDMKPDAPITYRGPFEPIATNVPGIQICELLPQLSRLADRYSLIRSLNHQSNDHGIAGTIALTGSINGAIGLDGKAPRSALKPSTGSLVARVGKTRNYAGILPAYVILGSQLHQGLKKVVGEGGGTLGSAYDPFRIDYEPGVGLKLPEVSLPESLTSQRFQARWDLRSRLMPTSSSSSREQTPEIVAGMDRNFALARELMSSGQTLQALDVAREPEALRRKYGNHRFGQCCLLARRLVESGLPFVQVNWSTHVEGPEDAGDGGWDMHDRYFQIMQDRHGWMLDQSLSALISDLADRRMLERTLVLAVGEFGRTPKINGKAGRDHWNPCYSALIAGGGVVGGRTVGVSDKRGEYPAVRPVTPADLGSTVLNALGITTTDLTGLGILPAGQPIHELFT